LFAELASLHTRIETMQVAVSIMNSGQRLVGLLASYSVHCGLATLSFNFQDVSATVAEEDDEHLGGIFTSKRDSGTYTATLQRKKRKSQHDDSSRFRCYQGKWYNDRGRSGDFSIEWHHPDMPVPRMDATEAIIDLGNREEPVFLVPDRSLFDDQGTTIMELFLTSMRQRGIAIPKVVGDAVWSSWKKPPGGCGDRVSVEGLTCTATFILETFLRLMFPKVWHVMTPDRGYDSKDINVYSKGGSKGRHQDAQPYGSLVFVFCAGLSCKSSVWLKSGKRVDLEMKSGDCMLFEGKTWHEVHECIPGTSPFKEGEWLADRRLSILVRQKPPKSWMKVPR